jgi:II/X family phage/plasmid replication protein
MLDHLRLAIPFDASLVSTVSDTHALVGVDLHELGINLAARSVERMPDGSVSAQMLFHPYESLPTSFTGMAVKVFTDGNYWPFVEIKASPAKIMQGHNVFGSDSIELGAFEMIGFLVQAYPALSGMLYFPDTEVRHLDVTYSARLPDEKLVPQVINFLSNVSSGQTKPTADKKFQTSAYWGGVHSRLVQLKCYGKLAEFMSQLDEYKKLAKRGDAAAQRVVNVMSDPRIIEWTQALLRLEARIKHRKLERLGLPTKLFDLIAYQRANPDFLQTLWANATKPIFDALEGQTMKLLDDDSVYERLCTTFQKVTPSGRVSLTKARNLFGFYCALREHGCHVMKTRYSKAQYYDLIGDLILSGFSKAYLQNLHTDNKSNVVPMIRFLQVDFSAQRPDWYTEPVSAFSSPMLRVA